MTSRWDVGTGNPSRPLLHHPHRRSDLLQLITVRLMGTAHKPSSTTSTASVNQSQPLAGAGPTAVTAEQLALQLGQSRVQLGVNLPAHRLTRKAVEQGPGQGRGLGFEGFEV